MEKKRNDAVQQKNIFFMGMQHPLVYTAGLMSRTEHILNKQISIVKTRRGGSVTLHNIGQLVFYTVVPLEFTQGLESFIRLAEDVMLSTFSSFGYNFFVNPPHSGIWTPQGKIAFVGLALKNNCIYHGLAINLYNDLNPYKEIHSCGLTLPVTRLADFSGNLQKELNSENLHEHSQEHLQKQKEKSLQKFSQLLFENFCKSLS